jgi:hypothetical protein
MQISLAPDYLITEADKIQDPALSPVKVSIFLIRNAVAAKYPQGMDDRKTQRAWARIQRVLQAATDENDVAEISMEQADVLLEAIKTWKVPTHLVLWHLDLLDSLELAKSEADDAEKAKRNGGTVTKLPEAAKV